MQIWNGDGGIRKNDSQEPDGNLCRARQESVIFVLISIKAFPAVQKLGKNHQAGKTGSLR
jgi:hypothetical protein